MKPKSLLSEAQRLQRALFLAAASQPKGKLRKLMLDTIGLLQTVIDQEQGK